MGKYGSASIRLDEIELEYLLELVERNQALGGPLVGVEVLGALAEALDRAQEDRA